MRKELEDALVRDFPHLLQDNRGDPAVTCLCYGPEVEDGWEPLVRYALTEIEAERQRLLKSEPEKADFRVSQIKEKFGGLRIHLWGGNERVRAIINHAEWASFTICEMCGTTSGITVAGGWIKALCGPCREKWNKR